jgi:hypothetical protein
MFRFVRERRLVDQIHAAPVISKYRVFLLPASLLCGNHTSSWTPPDSCGARDNDKETYHRYNSDLHIQDTVESRSDTG